MKKRHLATILIGVLLVALAAALWLRPRERPPLVIGGLPAPCRDLSFEAVPYVVCEIDLNSYDVGLFHAGADGKPYGSLEVFDKAMKGLGRPVLLAMNGGMYHEDLTPVGLLVEDGSERAPLNLADAEGNFFLKPNGVFLIGRDGKAAVMESSAYAGAKPDSVFATQSGPMLVVDGALHPRFDQNGTSRYVRNGVGVRDGGTVVLAISRSEVSLGSFARLFRDGLSCRNALFLDGVVSALSDGDRMIVGGKYPAGPIIAVSARKTAQ
ncbi:phosphodiester glycosidase family protein [Mesorhizobium abyssinicae]|uniref:phosphodiester glycosidase family protein n=1 Tax=Mesorhizobium abyssinicae TaxID=1209958 RepID=UPI002A24D5A6|nr:phosphodiester glycosidase family protein [Mesorhizobium abyssinicae]MDX8436359.1 phosphodiester glycosidase family protein [Mesorhizobium abyssinicae]